MTRAVALALVGLAACANSESALDAAAGSASTPAEALARVVEFTVVPANQRSPDGDIRAFPQTFPPVTSTALGSERDFALDAPVDLTGVVVGDAVTPYAANGLPTLSAPASGTLELADVDGVVRFSGPTDPVDGTYDLRVLPGAWELRVVPDDALLAPAWRVRRTIEADERQDFALLPEQALYGQITVNGDPYPGAEVFAVDEEGRSSGVAFADSTGHYQIRVPAGRWEVVTSGIRREYDPELRAPAVEVTGDNGVEVDLDYPTLGRVLISLPVETPEGDPLSDFPVRFVARSLDGFGEVAAVTVEAPVNPGSGAALALLIPGVYDIEIAPTDGALAGFRREGVSIEQDGPIEAARLEPLVPLDGSVLDNNGAVLAGARVSCDEIGFAGRNWTTFSDAAGHWLQSVAPSVSCAVVPPGERSGLAITREILDIDGTMTWNVQLALGRPLSGTVTFEGEPEAFAVVEARDATGMIIGQALTDADGLYALTLPAE